VLGNPGTSKGPATRGGKVEKKKRKENSNAEKEPRKMWVEGLYQSSEGSAGRKVLVSKVLSVKKKRFREGKKKDSRS